jgi:hypothetical protein
MKRIVYYKCIILEFFNSANDLGFEIPKHNKEILMEIDDELIRGCQRYLDTLKERTRAIEKEKEEQRKLEEHKRIRREYWRHALYGKGRFVNLFVPSDSKLKKK